MLFSEHVNLFCISEDNGTLGGRIWLALSRFFLGADSIISTAFAWRWLGPAPYLSNLKFYSGTYSYNCLHVFSFFFDSGSKVCSWHTKIFLSQEIKNINKYIYMSFSYQKVRRLPSTDSEKKACVYSLCKCQLFW